MISCILLASAAYAVTFQPGADTKQQFEAKQHSPEGPKLAAAVDAGAVAGSFAESQTKSIAAKARGAPPLLSVKVTVGGSAAGEEASPCANSDLPLALYIAPEPLFESRKAEIERLGYCVERSKPVVTNETCIMNNEGQTGASFAHQNAWKMAAPRNKKVLILEANFSIGNQDPGALKKRLSELHNRNDMDYFDMGHCIGHQGMVGYMLDPKALTRLVAETDPLCDKLNGVPADNHLKKMCDSGELNCEYEEKVTMPGLFGQGLFQQDRIKYPGVHDMSNMVRPITDPSIVTVQHGEDRTPAAAESHDGRTSDPVSVVVTVGKKT